jgi:hypothetical protein
MFEEELELEKQESSVLPLVLIVGLIAAIVGVAGYYVVDSRRVLTTADATRIATDVLHAQGAASVRFRTGLVTTSSDEQPKTFQYRLLEKAGLLKIGKGRDYKTPVALTAEGEKMLAAIPGVQKSTQKNNNIVYTVPVAERKLVSIGAIKMITPTYAAFEYTWKWETNPMGDYFDAAAPLVKSFNSYERSTLIDKYGANFYHGEPSKGAMRAVRSDKTWARATE